MSKFNELSKINNDIELLESYGDYKAADILHNQFLRTAQSLEPSRESGPYKQVFDKYFLSARTNPTPALINAIKKDAFLLKEDQDKLVKFITEMLNTKPSAQQSAPTTAPITTQTLTQTNNLPILKNITMDPGEVNPELASMDIKSKNSQQPILKLRDPLEEEKYQEKQKQQIEETKQRENIITKNRVYLQILSLLSQNKIYEANNLLKNYGSLMPDKVSLLNQYIFNMDPANAKLGETQNDKRFIKAIFSYFVSGNILQLKNLKRFKNSYGINQMYYGAYDKYIDFLAGLKKELFDELRQ